MAHYGVILRASMIRVLMGGMSLLTVRGMIFPQQQPHIIFKDKKPHQANITLQMGCFIMVTFGIQLPAFAITMMVCTGLWVMGVIIGPYHSQVDLTLIHRTEYAPVFQSIIIVHKAVPFVAFRSKE